MMSVQMFVRKVRSWDTIKMVDGHVYINRVGGENDICLFNE